MRPLICAALLILGSARAAVFLALSEDTEETLEPGYRDWRRDACTSMAAGLAPCLAANTLQSGLTTSEEATCCESLVAFQQAGCFCLKAVPGIDSCAYRRRAAGLANVHERCTWQAISCEDADAEEAGSTSTEQPCQHGSACQHLIGGVKRRIHTSEAGSIGLSTGDSELRVFKDQVEQYQKVDKAVDIWSILVSDEADLDKWADLEVRIAVSLAVELSEQPLQPREPWASRIERRLRAAPVLYISLAVALTSFALLCLVRASGPAQPSRGGAQSSSGVVCAAEEARNFDSSPFEGKQ